MSRKLVFVLRGAMGARAHALAIVLVLAAPGCGPPEDDDAAPPAEGIETHEQELRSTIPPMSELDGTDNWGGWPDGFIEVCWLNENPDSARAKLIREAVEDT